MFSSTVNYAKLKTNLRLAMSRLKLLQKKKLELIEKSRKEIADYILAGKYERAKVRVEYIVREDYLVEALEIVEMYCDLLLARFGLISNMKELDGGISEAVSSLIWIAPRLSDVQELKVISDLLESKYGPSFAEACRVESIQSISTKLKHRMSIQSPPKLLVEKYMIEIARSYNLDYEPDPHVMSMEKGNDALLIDLSSNSNNLGGGGMPQPPGFLGYPQPPPLPHLMDPRMPPTLGPFTYPPPKEKELNVGPTAPPSAFSYNIPPDTGKEFNTDNADSNLPTYHNLYPAANYQNNDDKPKPAPRLKMSDQTYDLSELPSVPDFPPRPNREDSPPKDDDIDFDDLTKRFNELKKKH
ncbi:increased sodium tolerance 1-like protein isoform X2 [Leptinotarsa decemlineata]|uniref:increased sodium tolerance 1-like protein isoform X2 n=1 Tax=Leptinotarsa decemlineata TaxID=7539 RepID=UPI003D30AB3A